MNFITDLLAFISQFSYEQAVNSGMLDYWVDKALRLADSAQTTDDKISSLSFLVEVWYTFSGYMDMKPDHANAVLATLRKCARERSGNASIVASSLMFSILDKFASEKNQQAPMLYKTLIFLMIESSATVAMREHYLGNFSNLFKRV